MHYTLTVRLSAKRHRRLWGTFGGGFGALVSCLNGIMKPYQTAPRKKWDRRKWDWWSIGGGWGGHFPLKLGVPARLPNLTNRGQPLMAPNKVEPGLGDVVRVTEIDLDRCFEKQIEWMKDFWGKYQIAINSRSMLFELGDNFRSRAMSDGILRLETSPKKPVGANELGLPWGPGYDGRSEWRDVFKLLTEEQFYRDHADGFDPLRTYAVLDDKGWDEAGSESENELRFFRSFRDRVITQAEEDDLLVLIDYHI